MRISDWSSDVCSSDLLLVFGVARQTYDFHTIEQCRRNIQGIAGSHEHYIGQIEIDLDVVILEGMVLLRVQHLEQCRGRIATKIGAHLVDLVEDRKSTRLNSSN